MLAALQQNTAALNVNKPASPVKMSDPRDTVQTPSTESKAEQRAGSVAAVLSAKDYYQVLGLSRKDISKKTPPSVFTAAYKQMALRVHPDKTSEDGAEAAFYRLKQAIRILADPRLRDRDAPPKDWRQAGSSDFEHGPARGRAVGRHGGEWPEA